MISEISPTDLLYVESKKKKKKRTQRTDWWLPEVGGRGWAK